MTAAARSGPDAVRPDPGVLDRPVTAVAVPTRLARWCAAAGIGAVLLTLLGMAWLHLAGSTASISPMRRTISEYALTDARWLFDASVVVLALGAVTAVAAPILLRLVPAVSTGTVLSALGALALLTLVVFPKHDWAVGPSAGGTVHRIASVVAFLALPTGLLLLTRRRSDGWARTAWWSCVAALLWFSPLVIAVLLRPLTGTPWYRAVPLGFVERGLAAFLVLAVLALAVWGWTRARRPLTVPEPATATNGMQLDPSIPRSVLS
ncbi:DUF998 domain-containing protein [Nakamurella leprariae]|uniref:DUF998 domain-containing protein n=1 Tax=Nakamurella leprariae TaxID=2803911 RepID=A0A938YJ15_9ACTN|nr:DUF998 domain-containing protein [Nakamurella leprariae]MBM9468680.1 DUF998 domain-containing protein [Nakamurella leprariae]